VYVCMCACVHVCMCMRVHVCVYTGTGDTIVCVYLCTGWVCVYVCKCVCVCVCVYVQAHLHRVVGVASVDVAFGVS